MTTPTTFETRSFAEFDARLLHDLYRLRAEVFIVEQVCPYQDIDGRDLEARHILGFSEDRLVACARIIEEERAVWIGRIATAVEQRGRGLGRAIVEAALALLEGDPRPRLMHAQAHLEAFYGRLGFEREAATFLEDGIPHILMRRRPGPETGD